MLCENNHNRPIGKKFLDKLLNDSTTTVPNKGEKDAKEQMREEELINTSLQQYRMRKNP